VRCVLGHKWRERWGDDEKKKTDAKSKKTKSTFYKFLTLTLGLPILNMISNP
jgi:hypothetical protein